jgi:hypothetical protein
MHFAISDLLVFLALPPSSLLLALALHGSSYSGAGAPPMALVDGDATAAE